MTEENPFKHALARLHARVKIDILLSLNGEDSYGLRCWSDAFGGFLPQPPYFSGGQPRGLTSGQPGPSSLRWSIQPSDSRIH
jgi:hypothetical protein